MAKDYYICKRLLTDKEFDEYIKIEDNKKQKKYLEKLEEELWYLEKIQRDYQKQ